ncbi:MAG: peptidylprolyl isomerase [Dethiobacteria bacterium]
MKEIVIKPVPNRTDYGRYAAFGFVIEGMDVADKIVAVQRDRADKPLKDQRIRTVTVEKNGVDYEPPVKA